MGQSSNTGWHFPIMILASFIIFYLVVWCALGLQKFKENIRSIIWLSILCVVGGMVIGKYGALRGLKWWIYYPIPMIMNVLMPPIVLKMNSKQILIYLSLSFLSAPLIHFFFSFFFNWTEYMPFWKISYIADYL
jgi:hypothetical protein